MLAQGLAHGVLALISRAIAVIRCVALHCNILSCFSGGIVVLWYGVSHTGRFAVWWLIVQFDCRSCRLVAAYTHMQVYVYRFSARFAGWACRQRRSNWRGRDPK